MEEADIKAKANKARLQLMLSLHRDVRITKKMTKDEAVKVCTGLIGNNHALTLDLLLSPVSGDHTKKIFDILCKNYSLHNVLLCFSSPPTPTGERSFIDYLKDSETLRLLRIRWDNYSPVFINAINLGISSSQCLETLDLSESDVGPKGAQMLSSMLQQNNAIKNLRLNDAQLMDEGIVHITYALETNTSLKVLEVAKNDIEFIGAGDVAKMLKTNRVLTTIKMNSNRIKDEGLRKIAVALGGNTTLTSMDVTDNRITKAARKFLLDLDRNFSLYKFDMLEGNYLEAIDLEDSYGYRAAAWNKGKVVVVGDSGVGKTSTVRSLLEEYFVKDKRSTVGIDINVATTLNTGKWKAVQRQDYTRATTYRLAVRSHHENIEQGAYTPESALPAPTGVKNKAKRRAGASSYDDEEFLEATEVVDDIGLTIWDYSGQPVFRIIHHLFLTKCGVYLCVFNVATFSLNSEQTLDTIERWLNSIKLYASSAPVFIVGTHADNALPSELTQAAEALGPFTETFENVQTNIDTSSVLFAIDNRSHHGIHSLRAQVERAVRDQEFVQSMVPRSWSRALEKLTKVGQQSNKKKKKKPVSKGNPKRRSQKKAEIKTEVKKTKTAAGKEDAWLPFEAVKDVFESCEVGSELHDALAFFHDIGAIVYLRTTEQLAKFVTTKPQWLVDRLSDIIRDRKEHSFGDKFKEEFETKRLTDDVDNLFHHGLASRDLLEILWNPDQVDFLLDLMQTLLLMSKWQFGANHGALFLLPCMTPSLLQRTSAGDTSPFYPEDKEASFEINFPFLPDGVFARVECICVEECPKESQPVIYNDAAKFCFKSLTCTVSLVLERNLILVWVVDTESKEHEVEQTKSVARLINATLRHTAVNFFENPFRWEFNKDMGIFDDHAEALDRRIERVAEEL